jgi:hypothetical protein
VLAARVDRRQGILAGDRDREVERAATLAEWLRNGAAAERAAIAVAVARALRTMHDRGVHHRDPRSLRILLRREGDRIDVHLTIRSRATATAMPATSAGALRRRRARWTSSRRMQPRRRPSVPHSIAPTGTRHDWWARFARGARTCARS